MAGVLGFSLLIAAASAPAQAAKPPEIANVLSEITTAADPSKCKSKDPGTILVCGRPAERYRIDPAVLEASRAADAAPPKPPLHADQPPNPNCIGPQHCGDAIIPLVAMAEVAVKAAALAVDGEDWREALRTHADEYRLYQDAEARKAKSRRMRFGFSASK